MARFRPKLGPIGLALTAWDVYRRLPPQQQKLVRDLARKHGPRVAARAYELRRTIRKK
jgi:hypothetical protein